MGFAVKARRPRMGYRFKIISLPCTNPAEASCIIERPGALRNPSLCFVEEANKSFTAEGAEESMGAWERGSMGAPRARAHTPARDRKELFF